MKKCIVTREAGCMKGNLVEKLISLKKKKI
jgi:hypothetical protein